jgi:hypothetical protein
LILFRISKLESFVFLFCALRASRLAIHARKIITGEFMLVLRETEYGNVFLTRRILSLIPEIELKLTDKYKRLRQLAWRPCKKAEKRRKKKEER